jgi:hypothetical protein
MNTQAGVGDLFSKPNRVGLGAPVGQDLKDLGPEALGQYQLVPQLESLKTIGDHGPQVTRLRLFYLHDESTLAPS